jgi:hypothetical protein
MTGGLHKGAEMAEPAYAVVDILCDPARLKDIEAIPNLRVEFRPEYTKDPGTIVVHAFADAAAQAAVVAMGCALTVIKSAEAYRQHIEDVYRSLGDDKGTGAIG